jgi:hypothetical protein
VLIAAGLLSLTPSTFASYQATAYVPSGTVIGTTSTPGDVAYSYYKVSGPVTSSAVVAFTSSPIASVNYAASVSNPLGQGVLNGGGIMTYSFQVAASPFTTVPVDFFGIFSSFQTAANSEASTSITVQTTNSNVSTYATVQSYFYGDCGHPGCLQFTTVNANFTYTQSDAQHMAGSFQGTLNMQTGAGGTVSGSVQLFAGANLNVFPGTASAASYIDPHLEINAAFLAANPGASLTLTAGVGNEVLAVPEPGSYALLLAGLGVVVIQARRLKRV